ncbi:O-methyltransferase [Lederbergia graminis]|uniref:tRNA 5-hydroxyuridine methyltransferase n=1 Tax=Lederbergia graminis TaxID=735518 RepID=A0ABW0LM07_9BACI
MKDAIDQYLEGLLPERSELFQQLEQFAKENKIPIMEPMGIETLLQLLRIQGPKRILEIGTAIGYSALRMVDAIDDVHVVTLEMDETRAKQAEDNIVQAGMANRITIIKGNALELFGEVKDLGPFDAIFIDAAKGQYTRFFEIYEPLLTNNGCIYSDNVLFKGLVALEPTGENKRLENIAKKIRGYNQWLMNNQSYRTVIIPTGDGLAISRKIK